MTTTNPGALFNPMDPALIANPYPVYQALREHAPCFLPSPHGPLILTSYEDVDEVLRDHARFSNQRYRLNPTEEEPGSASMLNSDPPDHTRLRSLCSRAFTPRKIAQLEAHVRETAHGLLDEVEGQSEFDLMATLAALLPTVVIAELIGVPTKDREAFKAWSTDFIAAGASRATPAEQEAGQQAGDSLTQYFSEQVELRRQAPADDLMTRLIAAEEAGDQLTHEELISTLILLLLAGNETTTNLIGNGLKALLEHPDQLDLLRRQPELMPTAIDELLRYDAPVQVDSRVANGDFEFGGHQIADGTEVLPVIGAANRDPAEFENPEQLDLTRADSGNISFGRGLHYCLGAPLAKLEGRLAFEALLERFSAIQFGSSQPEYRHNLVFRGLREFNIAVERR